MIMIKKSPRIFSGSFFKKLYNFENLIVETIIHIG